MTNCIKCSVALTEDNWYSSFKKKHIYICKRCQKKKANAITNPKHNPVNNPNRMWVNGKYISKKHPLFKPGRYKTFEDAAFSSLSKYELSREGQVYIITNPNFPDWVKVGMAVDSEDRLNGYQTSSPFRDYALFTCWSVTDRRSAESEAHALLEKSFDRKGEWFNCTPEQAQSALADLMEQHK